MRSPEALNFDYPAEVPRYPECNARARIPPRGAREMEENEARYGSRRTGRQDPNGAEILHGCRDETQHQPPYNVVILNDEEHTFEYVIELLTKLFGHPLEVAQELTWRVHTTGRAVVYTTHREKAELKREQVLAYGPDPRMEISKGPLGCYIEPAPMD